MKFTTALILIAQLLCVAAFMPHTSLRLSQRTKQSQLTMRQPEEKAPAGETDEQMRERLRRKARKMMFNENGVAYAPWVAKQINEDAIIDDLIRKEQGSNKKGDKASILERGEIQGSDGMKWRMSNGQVQLAWSTGGESGNKGFLVEKRPSYAGDYQVIASFKDIAQLVSKGASGGKYTYTDPSTAGGSWIYRVKDCDDRGKSDILCQCFVEVTTEAEAKSQTGVLVGFLAVLGGLAIAGVSLNPQF